MIQHCELHIYGEIQDPRIEQHSAQRASLCCSQRAYKLQAVSSHTKPIRHIQICLDLYTKMVRESILAHDTLTHRIAVCRLVFSHTTIGGWQSQKFQFNQILQIVALKKYLKMKRFHLTLPFLWFVFQRDFRELTLAHKLVRHLLSNRFYTSCMSHTWKTGSYDWSGSNM